MEPPNRLPTCRAIMVITPTRLLRRPWAHKQLRGRNALGFGSGHVVLPDHRKHGVSRQADRTGGKAHGQGYGWQDRYLNPPEPDGGSHLSTTANKYISNRPNQKVGMERPVIVSASAGYPATSFF